MANPIKLKWRTSFHPSPPEPFFTGTSPDFPAHNLISMDDEQSKEIMLKLGITELFADSPEPLPGMVPPPGRADVRVYVFKEHPTHYFLCVRWESAPNPADNGYAVYGYLKTKHTHAEFVELTLQFCRMFDAPVVTYSDRDNPITKS